MSIDFDHLHLLCELRSGRAMLGAMKRAPLRLPAALAALLSCAPSARAQPVSFRLKNDVLAGQRPSLDLTAVERVQAIELALTRDDGEKFEERVAGLAAGGAAVIPIGDGKAGKAHYAGRLALIVVGSGPWSYDLAFDTVVRAGMTVNYDEAHLDLAGRTLRFRQSRAAGGAEVSVLGEDGAEIGKGTARYDKEPPGTWLAIGWAQSAPGRVMTIKLHAVAADGIGANVELVPWAVEIEHQDVHFDTDSAAIKASEAGKLDASLAKINEAASRAGRFIRVKLYVAGHTDTVGSREKNRRLSLDRARAIAGYFREKGLAIPIAYEGFGEEVQKVPTPDNTDNPDNRRADYVLGAESATPPFGGPYRAAHAEWKTLK